MYGSMNRAELAEKLKDDAEHSKYMETCHSPYIEKHQREKGKRSKPAVHGRTAAVEVAAHNFTTLEYNKSVGVLWPMKMVEAKFGKPK